MAKSVKKVLPAPINKTNYSSSAIWLPMGICIVVIGLFQVIQLRWVSDDAFITFRYVKNFVEGHGIVYNVGEYVEGYTHFLWLLILSLTKLIGFDQVDASMWIGIALYSGVLVIYILMARKEQLKNGLKSSQILYIPLAAILLALNYDMAVWASGGLETALYTFFISLALYLWFYSNLSEKKRLLIVGSTLLLATLTRPDGALFTLTGSILLLIMGIKNNMPVPRMLRNIAFLLLPSILVGIPYLLWKISYYGDIFPATYYAKSADQNYYAQGFFYIWLFFKVYFSAAIALIIFGITWIYQRNKFNKGEDKTEKAPLLPGGSLIATITSAVIVYLVLNVAKVGGDFMFARFIIPVLPLIYYLIELLIERISLLSQYKYAIWAILIGSIIFEGNVNREKILFHFDQQTGQLAGNWDGPDNGETHGIADERWVYTRKRFFLNGVERGALDVYSDIGKYYEPFFAGLPVTVAIIGGQNMIAYYANFQTCINEYGLTDTAIAHLPIQGRGRIGHEKMATEEYFIKRGVEFQLFAVMPKIPEERTWNMAVLEIPEYGLWQLVKVITYDKPIIDELSKRFHEAGSRTMLPKYEMLMPLYLKNVMPNSPVEKVKDDYDGFKELFFNRYPDPSAQRQIEDYIMSKSNVTRDSL